MKSSAFLCHVHSLVHPQVHRRGQQCSTGRDSIEHPVCHVGLFTAQIFLGAALQRVANQVHSAAQPHGQHPPERTSCLPARQCQQVGSQVKELYFGGHFYVFIKDSRDDRQRGRERSNKGPRSHSNPEVLYFEVEVLQVRFFWICKAGRLYVDRESWKGSLLDLDLDLLLNGCILILFYYLLFVLLPFCNVFIKDILYQAVYASWLIKWRVYENGCDLMDYLCHFG